MVPDQVREYFGGRDSFATSHPDTYLSVGHSRLIPSTTCKKRPYPVLPSSGNDLALPQSAVVVVPGGDRAGRTDEALYYEHPKSQKTIDEARRLLAEAGYTTGFSFELITAVGNFSDQAQLVANQIMRAIPNIKVNITVIDGAILLERAANADYDMQGWCSIHEPTAVANMKTASHSKGGRNSSQRKDPQMDDLLDRAGWEPDATKRLALLRDAQLCALETVPYIPVAYTSIQTGFVPEARGMRLGGTTAGLQMYLKEVWLDK